MIPSPLPLNGIAVLAVISPFTSQWQANFCPTQTPDYNGVHNLLL